MSVGIELPNFMKKSIRNVVLRHRESDFGYLVSRECTNFSNSNIGLLSFKSCLIVLYNFSYKPFEIPFVK